MESSGVVHMLEHNLFAGMHTVFVQVLLIRTAHLSLLAYMDSYPVQ